MHCNEQSLELKTAGNVRIEASHSGAPAPWAEHAETLLSALLAMADGSGSARDLLHVDRLLRLQNRGLKAVWQDILESCTASSPSVETLAWVPSASDGLSIAAILEHGFCAGDVHPGCVTHNYFVHVIC
jgi:hypothetical protein